MKSKLDESMSNINEPQVGHHAWAQGFVIRGKRQFHPYTQVRIDAKERIARKLKAIHVSKKI